MAVTVLMRGYAGTVPGKKPHHLHTTDIYASTASLLCMARVLPSSRTCFPRVTMPTCAENAARDGRQSASDGHS